MPSTATIPPTVAALLAAARTARDASALTEGRSHAERAWALAAEPGVDPADRIAAGHLLCLFLMRQGALAALIEVAEQVLPLLGPEGQHEVRFELMRWLVLAGCELGRHELALRYGNLGFALAQQIGNARHLSLAQAALGACFERMGDPWQAERLMGDALVSARQLDDPQLLLSTLNNLCAVAIGAFYLLRVSEDDGQSQAALVRALGFAREAQALLPKVSDPYFHVFIIGNLGEVLLHHGELVEARERLEDALERGEAGGHLAQVWRIRCSLGELLLAEGHADKARRLLRSLLQQVEGQGPRATLVRTHHALYRACRRLGRTDEALEQLEHYERLERGRAVAQLKAQSALFITRVEAEQTRQDAERARREVTLERERAASHAAEALRDPLTALGNRRLLDQRLPEMLASARRRQQPLCAAVIDLDHFKRTNDHFGHAVGDQVLQAIAEILRRGTRDTDLLVRLGGEEFLVALPDTRVERAVEVCERMREQVAAYPWQGLAPGLRVTLSAGIALNGDDDAPGLLERADRAMYQAKAAGRNRTVVG